ncbi:hypothetical protein SAMN05216466_10658 [Paraburkholderia phenazinium]|uniref:Uncharacterized protein n=1 Tax=Paraburkholderia phenazinium TaxID=60549 RepID=A0A1G7Y6K3_9BURK|nr:hypothetical protein [Paraburkholderia phenazinium]SDG92081.1 hypothetical protein SAMN05216466_10658 [Paraburkholderia phenazinium]
MHASNPQPITTSTTADGSFRTSQAHPTGTCATPEPFHNARYASAVIDGMPEQFDGIEIQGVREFIDPIDPDRSCCELDNQNPAFFSVYLHHREGGVACVADLESHELAVAYAELLAGRYDWTINDYCIAH